MKGRLRDHCLDELLALAEHRARRWKPKRLRHRLFTAARLIRTGRRQIVHHDRHHPWADLVVNAVTRLRLLAAPG